MFGIFGGEKCPKCGRRGIKSEIVKVNRVNSTATGAGIGSIFGPWGTVVGGAVGAARQDYVKNHCSNCGHVWRPKSNN